MKGLSIRNIKYMRAFAEAYPDFIIVRPPASQLRNTKNNPVTIVQAPLAQLHADKIMQAPLAQLSWYHHITLLDKIKDPAIRLFYIDKAIKNGWSRNVLSLQIESRLHQRQGKAITNFDNTLPSPQSDLAKETPKNPYLFDFLGISEEMQERDLEKALIQYLKKFMLELGRGFAYVGNQKNLNVAGEDFFLDLLFYNYYLHCFVVFELKIGEFEPEFAGKLNFYVNAINEQIKGKEDKPTIGVLLCKTPNDTVVKFSLQGIKTPLGVADYELAKALPKQLKAEMPTVEELETEIEREYKELKTPAGKRPGMLKRKLPAKQKKKKK
jgi:predicted nuclease of restriction endonuclease-like (RecB) superfamily